MARKSSTTYLTWSILAGVIIGILIDNIVMGIAIGVAMGIAMSWETKDKDKEP